ncbi:MAG TPA: tetratricopeptide repeat protein [Pirellulales bacterium]|jgi:tetratricopeptide (TPR) repeat protein|nr:tetratricopeptide repeat protein [Pirellulales bacterium]
MHRVLGVTLVVFGFLGVERSLPRIARGAPPNPAEARAIAALEKLGGKVDRADGDRGDVIRVNLKDAKFTNAGLVQLKAFLNLQELDLTNTQITNAAAGGIASFRALKTVTTTGTALSAVGAKIIKARLPDVKIVDELDLEAKELPPLRSAELYVERANQWIDDDQTAKALADLTRAIAFDPKAEAPYYWRGWVRYWNGEFDKALPDFDMAVRLAPSDFHNVYWRGVCFAQQQKYDAAITDFDAALNLVPDDLETLCERGTAWSHKRQLDKAMKDLNKAIELDPDYGFAWYCRGSAWLRAGSASKAIDDLSKAIACDADDSQARLERGIAYEQQGKLAEAVDDFTACITGTGAAHFEAHRHRGEIRFKQQDYSGAIDDFELAADLHEDDIDNLRSLARASALKGDFKAAVQWQTKAVDRSAEKHRPVCQSELQAYRASRLP